MSDDCGQAETLAQDRPPLNSIRPRIKPHLPEIKAGHFESLLRADHRPPNAIQVVEDDVYVIDDVLLPQECKDLVDSIEGEDTLSFWCEGLDENPSIRFFRNAETIEMHSAVFANKLWRRVEHLLAPLLDVNIEDERDMNGRWLPYTLNPDSLFVRYPQYGAFAPHTDGSAIIDFNHRSLFSVIIFLNSVPVDYGAGTRFYCADATSRLCLESLNAENMHWTAAKRLITSSVPAIAGRMLLFRQTLVHEGIPALPPHCKYIIRSDVMFRRDPPLCDDPKSKEAYQLFRQAEELAENGDTDASIVLFRKAFKLSPQLAAVMGHG